MVICLEAQEGVLKPVPESSLRYLVSTSNYIREGLLERLIQSNTPLEECYHSIHRVHFLDEKKALSIGTNNKHRGHDTPLPVREHDSLSLVPLSTLHEIKSKLFSTIESTDYNGDFSDYITTLDMLLTICHIPHDGAGRTNEDFLVLYALKHGIQMSFSENGYRGQLNIGSLVHERQRNLRTFLDEIRATYLEDAIREKESEMVCGVYDRDFKEIKRKKQAKEPDFVEFQVKKRRIALLLLNALENPDDNIPQKKTMFPKSFSAYKDAFTMGKNHVYQIINPE